MLVVLGVSQVSATVYEQNAVYSGTISPSGTFIAGNVPVTGASAIGFVCADKDCTSISGTLWNGAVQSTGSSNTVTLQYPTTLQSQYGYLIYFYKDGYIPWSFISNWAGEGTAPGGPFNDYLSRKEGCRSLIDDFTVLNDVKPNIPLVIGVSASLDATTYSAFQCASDRYIPESLRSLVSSDVRVTLQIFDSDNHVVFSQAKDMSLYCSASKRVEFTWTPTDGGSYRAVARTDVTDAKCISEVPQQASKDFSVLASEPYKQCYTLINNLAISNPYPRVGDKLGMSFSRVSNYAEDNYALTPVSTGITIKVVEDSTGNVVYSKSDHLAANPDTVAPVEASYTLDTSELSAGQYTIKVTGKSDDSKCSGVDTSGETERLGFFLEERPVPPQNTAPVLEGLPDRTTYEDSGPHADWTDLYSYASDKESTDDELSFSIISQSDPSLISCHVDGDRFVSCDAPAKDMTGTNTITVQVSDGEYTDTDSFDVIVQPVDDAPVISPIPDVTFAENTCYSLDLDKYVTDVDNSDSELSWSVTGNHNVAISINPDSHVAKFCAYSWHGSEDVVFRVTDPDGLSDTADVKVTVTEVHVNQPPVISDIPDVTFQENTCYSLDLDKYASDPDNSDSELSWSFSGNHNVQISIDRTTHVAKFCAHDWYGSENVVFRVTDPGGLYDTDNVKVIVTKAHVNQPPAISGIPDVVLKQGECIRIDLDNFISDPDNAKSELTLSVSGNHNVQITIDSATHVAKFCAGTWTGTENIVFMVTDPEGLYDTDNMKVTVTKAHEDQPPKITGIPDVEFDEGSCYSLDLDNYVTDPDYPKSELTWEALYNNYVDITIDPATHVAKFCADNFHGKDYVSFRVTDPDGLSDKDDVVVTVNKVAEDQPPVISDIPDVSFPEDTCKDISLDNYVTDPDNAKSELVWGVSGNYNINVAIDKSTHVATLCPKKDWNGIETLKFTVTDPDMKSDSDDMKATVTPVNDAPVITGIPDVTFDEYSCYSLDLDNYVKDPDNSYSELTWEVLYNNFVQVTIDPETHVAKFCADDFYGKDYMTFKVTDPDGASDKADIVVTVNKVIRNKAPVLDVPDQSVQENSGLNDNLVDLWQYASDETPDSGLSFSLDSQSRPDIVSCTLDTDRYIDCTTQPDMFGTSEVTVSVSDGEFTSTDTFAVNVQEVVPGKVSVKVKYPNGGEILKGTEYILWDAMTENNCSGPMTIRLDYSDDSGATWHLIAEGEENDGTYAWNTKGLKDLSTYLVKVTASDCETSGQDTSDGIFTINNHPATISEEKPVDYSVYVKSIVFENPNGDMPMPGEELEVLVTIENTGDRKLEDLRMMGMSDELGGVYYTGPFELGRTDQIRKRLILDIPSWTKPGEYPLRITISNNDVKRVVYRYVDVS